MTELSTSELLRLVARGLSITEIARQRGIARTDLARELRHLADILPETETPGSPHETAVSRGRTLSLVAYTDGGSRGNPGPAGIGVVLEKDGQVLAEKGLPIGTATNNVAEYRAVIEALDMARTYGATELEVRMDSELVVRQLSGRYKIRDERLMELAEKVRELAAGFGQVRWSHVPRERNARADALVNGALDGARAGSI
jgi:ribonuclease HI